MKAMVEVAFFLFIVILCCNVSSCSMLGEPKMTEGEKQAMYAGYVLGNVDGCVHVFRMFKFPEDHCKQYKTEVIEKVAKKIVDDEEENE